MDVMDKIVSLCKRRGFIYPGSEVYGGLANSWDYGPLGVELKNNIKRLWWERFVHRRDDIVGIDASLIMNPRVWEASGHLANFSDPLVECRYCHLRVREDHIGSDEFLHCNKSEDGKHKWTERKMFNLMFKTFIGPAQETSNIAYFRPETAQAMFVDFKNVLDTSRVILPFGIAQIGKAFRNEITPGNFIFRTREFEQMEIEYFIPPPKKDSQWQDHFENWRKEMHLWMSEVLCIDQSKLREHDIPEKDRAHYSKKTIDFEYDFPFGQSELYGLAYRTDFDLKNHQKYSGRNLKYKDPQSQEEYWPHVIEPTWGVDRSVLVVLIDGYREETFGDKTRVYLKLSPKLAPYKVAVFPLVANKPELTEKAKRIYKDLRKQFMAVWDDRGNIGKRYLAQDEIGTPWCVTVDYDTLKDDTVTIRDRDTTKQIRCPVNKLMTYFANQLGLTYL